MPQERLVIEVPHGRLLACRALAKIGCRGLIYRPGPRHSAHDQNRKRT